MKKIFLIFCLSWLFSCHTKRNAEYMASISKLPSFGMLLMDSTTVFQAKQIPDGKSVMVLFFRPDCIHCQKETEMLVKNIQAFKNVQIYFLASAPFDEVKNFCQAYRLDQYQNITVGKDYEHSFVKVFQPTTIPYMVIYDGQKRFVKLYYGEVDISSLVAATQSQSSL